MMNELTDAEFFADASGQERKALFFSLNRRQQQDVLYHWNFWARPEQRPPEGDWSIWLIMAGRGFGKTRAGAEWVRQIAECDGSARFALVGANYAETRTVMVEGESGLLSIAPPKQRPNWEPSLKRLTWKNGAQAHLYSAAEPEGLRGPRHSHSCGQAHKELFHNEALTRIDYLIHPAVQAIDTDSTALIPVSGRSWIVGSDATDEWTGHHDEIAGWTGNGWLFMTPLSLMRVYIESTDSIAVYGGCCNWNLLSKVRRRALLLMLKHVA